MDDIEQIEHSFWGQVIRIAGHEDWFSILCESMIDGAQIEIRVEFDDPDNEIVQRNYTAIRKRWTSLWARIQERTQELKTSYGNNTSIHIESDWFELRLPTEPIENEADWSVMLQTDEAGWLLDFEGWDDAGGQGVF